MLHPLRLHPLFAVALLFIAPLPLENARAAAEASELRKIADGFFDDYCLDCHEAGKAKGGMNLEKADAAIATPEQIDLWVHVYDRIARGEMPPAKQTQPEKAEVEQLLGALRPRLLEADRARREVVQR
ncbi:MAG TPA: c-type cytochrome domain-containing protein, partial [Chthoniobacteraceae bacterium]